MIRNKISFSEKKNEANLTKILKKQGYMNEVIEKTNADLVKFADTKNKQYQELLKKLIIQGMTQMLEPIVVLRVRKEDESYIKDVLKTCEQEFSKVMKEATGRDYSTKLSIDKEHLLTKLGGIHLFDETLKIQCTNDLESRLDLSYQKLLPELKKMMFK